MLLIFDLDDTLYEMTSEFREAGEKEFTKKIMKHKNLDYEKALELLKNTQQKLKSEGEKYTFIATFEELRISGKEFYNALNSIELKDHIKEDKKVTEMLKNLSKLHKIVVFSNNAELIVNKMVGQLGIKSYIEKVYTSEGTGLAKPDSYIFKKIAGEMGFKAEECVSIGDSVHKEILPAKAVGMKTVLIISKTNPVPKEEQQHADFVIESLEELPEVISAIQNR